MIQYIFAAIFTLSICNTANALASDEEVLVFEKRTPTGRLEKRFRYYLKDGVKVKHGRCNHNSCYLSPNEFLTNRLVRISVPPLPRVVLFRISSYWRRSSTKYDSGISIGPNSTTARLIIWWSLSLTTWSFSNRAGSPSGLPPSA